MKLESFLPYRLNRAAAIASRQFSAIYRNDFNLTVPEWRTLATLGQFGAATATEIGEHSAMHKTKVSRAVAALQRRRWLVRHTNEQDRRIEHLSLSAAGRSAYAKLAPKMLAFEDAMIRKLDPEDQEALAKGLVALERALGIDRKTSLLSQRSENETPGEDDLRDRRRRVA
ncbi:MarR family transcriptional regulator [Pelagibius litoralis]|uniref:MarR family transcriptional regulator n=1 Tax=Pelagibius litoralis TaxID=374515 RepID=A0A967KBS1_9PROT|nr:MarR family transcriptional regulator [Pelagibius litoralis]NIA69285.1 MarR family transcriptional regulator [Pelagibius litoralis]